MQNYNTIFNICKLFMNDASYFQSYLRSDLVSDMSSFNFVATSCIGGYKLSDKRTITKNDTKKCRCECDISNDVLACEEDQDSIIVKVTDTEITGFLSISYSFNSISKVFKAFNDTFYNNIGRLLGCQL